MVQLFASFNQHFPVMNYCGNHIMPYSAQNKGVNNIQNPSGEPAVDFYDGQKPYKKAFNIVSILLILAAAVGLAALLKPDAVKKLINSASSGGTNNSPVNLPSNSPAPKIKRKPKTTARRPLKHNNSNQSKKIRIKQINQPSKRSKPKTQSGIRITRKPPKRPEVLANKAIQGILSKTSPNGADLRRVEDIFKQNTGINLYCPESFNIKDFCPFFDLIFNGKFNTRLDPEIKHIVIGHGLGSANSGNWRFLRTGENIFDFVEKNIPKGEKALLITCETAANAPKPGVGTSVNIALLDKSKPGKVVESGKRAVVGTLTQYNPMIQYF